MTSSRTTKAFTLAAIVAVAAALRLFGLDRWPPGLHYDEAAYGLQALELWTNPRLEVFFPAYTGREPLFVYVLAAAIGALGPSVLAIRLVAALIGIGAVATTFLVGRALFGTGVGLLGAGLLATSFWHVLISRMAYRAGLLALLTPLAIWLLWRLWQRPTPLRALIAGVALGALAYTYVGIRLLPLALALWAIGEAAAGPLRDRRRLTCAVLAAAVAVATAGPLLLHFWRNPADFGVRFGQTITSDVGQAIVATLGMYGLRGDDLQKYNLPLQPALNPLLTILFVAGLVVLGLQLQRSESRLLLCWLLGALLPGFLTADSPNFLRLIGAAPPSYLIAAIGGAAAWRMRTALRRLAPTAAAVLVLVQGGITARDYFLDWARSADTYYALDGDMAAVGRLAVDAGTLTYVASEHYRHPTVAYLAGPAFERLSWFDGRTAIPVPPPGVEAEYLIPHSARPAELDTITGLVAYARATDPAGGIAVERLRRGPTGSMFGGAARLSFGRRGGGQPLAELHAVDAPERARAGETLRVRTAWRLAADAPGPGLALFAHAVDPGGRRWGQRDLTPYLSNQWHRGEVLFVWFDLPLDATAPPGIYRLRLGLSDPGSPGAVEARRSDGAVVADPVTVPLRVHHGTTLSTEAATADLGTVVLLRSDHPDRLAVGQSAWLDLQWRAETDNPTANTELLLRGERGTRSLGARPLPELYTGVTWRAGEVIRDARRLVPRRADAGSWQLVVRVGGGEHALGRLEIALPPATFDLPNPQRPLDARLGSTARLLGLDVLTGGVRLYWQALEPSEAPLSIFVHALAADGRILTQHDGAPAAGTRPTTGWVPDEVIADDHPMPLPAAWAALAVGIYDPTTGDRLKLPDGTDHLRVVR